MLTTRRPLLTAVLNLSPAAVPPGTTGVSGSAVHALLHVRLVGASFVWELLLLSAELR